MDISQSTKNKIAQLKGQVLYMANTDSMKRGPRKGVVKLGWHPILKNYLLLIDVPGFIDYVVPNPKSPASLRNVVREQLTDQAFELAEKHNANLEFMGDKPDGEPKDGYKPTPPKEKKI